MNNPLEPIRVEFSDIPGWLKETVLLFRRRAFTFIAVSLMFFFTSYKLNVTGFVTFFLALLMCQICLVVCIVIARCADESRKLNVGIWYQSLLNSIAVSILLSAFYVLLWVLAEKIASLLMLEEFVSESSVPPPIDILQWLYPGTFYFFIVYIGVMVTTMWFLIPLTVFYRFGVVDAVLFAKQGERKNFPVVALAAYAPFFAFFVLFIFSELALVVAVVALPLFAIYLYVSFRHVYMGRKESQPQKVEVVVGVPAGG